MRKLPTHSRRHEYPTRIVDCLMAITGLVLTLMSSGCATSSGIPFQLYRAAQQSAQPAATVKRTKQETILPSNGYDIVLGLETNYGAGHTDLGSLRQMPLLIRPPLDNRRPDLVRHELDSSPRLPANLGPPVICDVPTAAHVSFAVGPSLFDRVLSDHGNYYSTESLALMAGGFGVGALMANTKIDQELHDEFQLNVRGASSDEWFEMLHAQKEMGNGRYTLPLFAAAWAAGELFDGSPVADATGEWGARSLRAVLVGTPPMLFSQYATGASRPGETSAGSMWKPFQDNNGVSGHAFMGAIPFLTAARMTDEPWLKAAFYAGSTLAPLSRINDDKHYPSQALLGWWMAWLATKAVDTTQYEDRNWSLQPLPIPGATGIAVEWQW